MNPRHCSGRFSNPDPLRVGGGNSYGKTLCCQPDVVLSFEGGRLPSCHGSAHHLVALLQVLTPSTSYGHFEDPGH